MDHVGTVLFWGGIVLGLIGFSGFFDTRKVDRRYRTGYKNNEPDSRNIGRSLKILALGIVVCIVGKVIIGFTESSDQNAAASTPVMATSDPAASDSTASVPDAASTANPVMSLDPTQPASQPASDDSSLAQTSVPAASTPVIQATATTVAPASSVDTTAGTPAVTEPCSDDGTYFGANVCKSAALSEAYERELHEYSDAQAWLGGNDAGVRIEQRNWLAGIVSNCADSACLAAAFDGRATDLHARYRASH